MKAKTQQTNKDAETLPARAEETRGARRPYQLTPAGLASLRSSAQCAKPWTRSTGPRTPDGKARSRMNAMKHGERSSEAVLRRRELTDLLALIKGMANLWGNHGAEKLASHCTLGAALRE